MPDDCGMKRWAMRARVQPRILHLIPVWGTLIAPGQLPGSIWSKLKSKTPCLTHKYTHMHKLLKMFPIYLRHQVDRKTTHHLKQCSSPRLKPTQPRPSLGFSVYAFTKEKQVQSQGWPIWTKAAQIQLFKCHIMLNCPFSCLMKCKEDRLQSTPYLMPA